MTPTTKPWKHSPKSHRLHVALSAEQFTSLKALRRETGAPVAELLRRAIALYLRQDFNKIADAL